MINLIKNYRKKMIAPGLGLVLLGILSSMQAGGYDQQPVWEAEPGHTTIPWTHYVQNLYFGVSGGYAWSNWNNVPLSSVYTSLFPSETEKSANSEGDTWGLLMGYQLFPHFAIEIGGYDLFDGNRQIKTADSSLPNQQLFNDDASSYIIYGAAKGIWPLHQRFDVFGKIGPVYRSIDHTTDCTVTSVVNGSSVTTNCTPTPPPLNNSAYWSVFVAAGAETYLSHNVAMGIEWYYVPGKNSNSDSDDAPEINALVGTISYAIHEL